MSKTFQGLTVVSTGCPSLDAVFMNGVPQGSVLLVHEDWPRSSVNHSSLLLKSFLAEAVSQQEECLLVAADESSGSRLIESLPEKTVESMAPDAGSSEDKFKIAWRYRHLQHGMEIGGATKCPSSFDFGKIMEEASVRRRVKTSNSVEGAVLDAATKRVAIYGLGSPCFPFDAQKLNGLLCRIRERNMVCMVTAPIYCMDVTAIRQLQHLSDCTISLETASQKSLGIDCFLTVVKPFTLIRQYLPPTLTMSMSLDKRRLKVQPFHLPPDLGGDSNAVGSGCASKRIDF